MSHAVRDGVQPSTAVRSCAPPRLSAHARVPLSQVARACAPTVTTAVSSAVRHTLAHRPPSGRMRGFVRLLFILLLI